MLQQHIGLEMLAIYQIKINYLASQCETNALLINFLLLCLLTPIK